MEREICKLVAKIYAGRNRHQLSPNEIKLVRLLEENSYITLKSPISGMDGFVGHTTYPIV